MSCWHGGELVGVVSARDWSEELSNISQADVVQSLNNEDGSTANSSSENTRIWAVKTVIILFKLDMLFDNADVQNL